MANNTKRMVQIIATILELIESTCIMAVTDIGTKLNGPVDTWHNSSTYMTYYYTSDSL